MSRLGKKGIQMNDKTEATFEKGVFAVKGPKGSLERSFRPEISITITDKDIALALTKENNQTRALWGTYASHIKNMIKGVNEGFEKKLILEGVGFKSEVKGKSFNFALGFSHPVIVPIPEGITATADKNNITVSGVDKELVGSFTAALRALKKPEPYKGKGIRYEKEVIRRKQGKKTV